MNNMKKTTLDGILLKNLEKFTLNNKDIPVLMQKYPHLAQIAKKTLSQTNPIHLLMIENDTDYAYFILRTLAKESLIDLRKLDEGFFFDMVKFFKLLENYLIYFFDIKKIEATYFIKRDRKRNRNRNRKNNSIEEILLALCEKFEIKPNIFTLLNIKTWEDEKISFLASSELVKYTELLIKNNKKTMNQKNKKENYLILKNSSLYNKFIKETDKQAPSDKEEYQKWLETNPYSDEKFKEWLKENYSEEELKKEIEKIKNQNNINKEGIKGKL